MATLIRWWWAARVFFARIIAPADVSLHRASMIAGAYRYMVDLEAYAATSGHLTRAYHAGRRVQADAHTAATLLRQSSL